MACRPHGDPRHLVLQHAKSELDALIITKVALKICSARWPEAYLKICDGENYLLEDEACYDFILIEYGSRVSHDDVDMEMWNNNGAFIKLEVQQEILAEAMAAAEKVSPSDRASLVEDKSAASIPEPKAREKKGMTESSRVDIAARMKARWAERPKSGSES